MCSVSERSIYSREQLCGFGVGGKCNETIGECDCFDGYQHNLYFLRERDCSLPLWLMPVTTGLLIVLSTYNLVLGYHYLDKSIGVSKTIIQLLIITQVFLIMFSVGMYINNFIFDTVNVLISFVGVESLFLAVYFSFYLITKPLFLLSERTDAAFVAILKMSAISFRTIRIIYILCMIIFYGDHTVIENDYGWNVTMSINALLGGFEVGTINLFTAIYGRRLIISIENIISKTPDNPNHPTTRLYIKKVESYLTKMLTVSPIVIIQSFAAPIAYVYLEYIPFSYVPFVINWWGMALFCGAIIQFAAKESSKSETSVTSLKMT